MHRIIAVQSKPLAGYFVVENSGYGNVYQYVLEGKFIRNFYYLNDLLKFIKMLTDKGHHIYVAYGAPKYEADKLVEVGVKNYT